MARQGHRGIVPTKIRKRGCSSSSSSSSRVQNHRLNKRAILVSKNRSGFLIGSRSSTPVPTWRTTLRNAAIESPRNSQSGKSTQPVSARKLAATLWEMNETPTTQNKKDMVFKREKMQVGWGLHYPLGSVSLLPDPSNYLGVSEKMDRLKTVNHRGKTPSISQKLQSVDHNHGVLDTIGNASYMEVESRSRPQTSSGSINSGKNRLKDVSNALITSKELLKIINHMWARADQPSSSSMSLISALHAELERARFQVNQLIQEQRSDKNEIHHLMKCFAEEKASWKKKEELVVESAISSIAGELEVERKLRKRLENLNKKLGKEFAEMKLSFVKAVKELESEKRGREITEQVCDELARNNKVQLEKLERESSVKVHERVEKDLTENLHEEKVQIKLNDSKHQHEEKNSAISKLRKQLEVFLGPKKDKYEARASYSKSNFNSYDQDEQEDEGEVEDCSPESDLQSIELNVEENDKNDRGHRLGYTSRKSAVINTHNHDIKERNPISGQASRRSASLLRSVSDGIELKNTGERLDLNLETETQRRRYIDEMQRYKSIKGLKDHILSASRLSATGDYSSPSRERDQSRPLRDHFGNSLEISSKSRMGDTRLESQGSRRSKW